MRRTLFLFPTVLLILTSDVDNNTSKQSEMFSLCVNLIKFSSFRSFTFLLPLVVSWVFVLHVCHHENSDLLIVSSLKVSNRTRERREGGVRKEGKKRERKKEVVRK